MPSPWYSTGFAKLDRPILGPDPSLTFRCPVSGQHVHWAEKDVFNPAATIHDGRVHLLVRAEDTVGPFKGTSRIGVATSDDGEHFTVEPEPVIFPDRDDFLPIEHDGGCEDPRLVRRDDGLYICTYSSFNGSLCHLSIATSRDLRRWTKHGPAFTGTAWEHQWAKSGCIVAQWRDGCLEAVQINGRYWMYWGEGVLYAATSADGIRWTPVELAANHNRILELRADGNYVCLQLPGAVPALLPVCRPRPGRFDDHLVEPGPAAVLGEHGIALWYNGAKPGRDAGVYCCGQMLFDALAPGEVIERPAAPFLVPDRAWELSGQNAAVTFSEGLVRHRGRELLYYGCADSHIGVAVRSLIL